MSIKLFTLILIFLFFGFYGKEKNAYQKLTRLANSIPHQASLKHGEWSIYIINTENAEVLLDINGEKSLTPASNLKLITSAVALDIIGEEKKFKTSLEYSGTIDDEGTLQGSLYIHGEGDPTLGSPYMAGVSPLDSLVDQWVNIIRAQGIQQIAGDIIADDSYLDYMPLPVDWYWKDIGNYHAAGTSGLCINENLYYLFFKPAKKVGEKAIVLRTEPKVPGLTFFNHMRTGPVGSGDKGYIYAAPWQYYHQLEGTIPAGVKEFTIKGAFPDPAKFSAEFLYSKLTDGGIRTLGKAITIREQIRPDSERKVFYSNLSPPLKDIIYRLNKRSVNLYAEQLLKIIGKEVRGDGTLDNGIDVIKNWLKKKNIYTEGLFIHDGSGLSRANGTPTRFIAELLNTTSHESFFETFYHSLGIAGDPNDIGYMKRMCRGSRAAKNLRAKTGTIDRIRAHSGYVHTQSGKLLCFSMIANDYLGSRRNIDKMHEKVMIAMSELP